MYKKGLFLSACFLSCVLTVSAGDVIVARVNGAVITDKALEAAINRLIPRSSFHGNISEDRLQELRDKALDDLIVKELQYQDAVDKGLRPDKKRVKERFKKIKDRFQSRQDYNAVLEREGLTDDKLKSMIEKEVMVEMAIERTVTDHSHVGESELKDYYEKNITKFRLPESVWLRIISAKDERKIRDALARVKAGEDFGSVAARMSEDNFRIKGGDIGYVHRGRIYPEIEAAAFRLSPEELAGPIKAEQMWFIVKVMDKKPERLLTYDEIKDKLKKELERKRSAEIMEKWVSSLRAKSKIEILK